MFHKSLAAATALVAVMGASSAMAADLIRPVPAAPGVVQAANVPSGWEGPYVGLFGGYAAATWTDSWDIGGTPGSEEFSPTGALFGLVAGYDFEATPGVILGIAGDIAWTNIGFEKTTVSPTHTGTIDWIATLRARVGFDAGAFMPYLTGGLAIASATAEFQTVSQSTHIGWTVGAGVEIAATENISLDLQYRYTDLGSQPNNIGPIDYDTSITSHQVTVGLNWRF